MHLISVGLLFISICSGQYILGPKAICQFDLNEKTLEVISEFVVISVKYRQLVIAISPCAHFKRFENFSQANPKIIQTCNRNSRACISDNSASNSLINAGDRFIYTEIEEDGSEKENVLISVNGDKCQNDKNYKVIIHFDCKGTAPSYIPPEDDSDSCTYHVRMMDANCTPHCILRVDGQFLNLNKDLKKIPDITLPMGDDKKAVLSICRASTTCDVTNNLVACEVQSSTSVPGNTTNGTPTISALGTLSTEKVFWDENNQQIYLRSQIGLGKRNKRVTEIRLVCNWHENNKARIIKNENKMVQFEIETKFGCVKTAPNCKVKGLSGMSYNLENLYKTGNWLLDETPSKKIFLNVCGPLKASQGKGSLCHKTSSQVCDETGSINYGSIMMPIKPDQYNTFLTTSFIGGSVCSTNTTQSYRTNIKFICSLKNNPPAFVNIGNCSLNIVWETTEACPKYISSGKKCKMSNVYYNNGLLDLNELHTAVDRTISLSQSSSLKYNLCGKLTAPCNNVSEVSMCLINNGKESILGLENNKIIFVDGIIRSYFYNSYDIDETKPNVNVSFICNHKHPVDGLVSVHSLEDNVDYLMTVETPLACYTNITYPCNLVHENQMYDLTPLMKNDSNYELFTDQFKLQINVCRPVLTNGQSLCDLNTGACLTNLKEPSLSNKRYMSLGRSQKIIFDKELSLKYSLGTVCYNSRSFHMEATILFKCTANEETGPVFIQNNECNHTIAWHTKHACPKKVPVQKRSETECLIYAADKILYNFTSLRKHTVDLIFENNSSVKLNICNKQYILNEGDTKQSGMAVRNLIIKENSSYLQYTLINNYIVNLTLQCDHNQTNEGYEVNSSSNKTINFILRSLEICGKNTNENTQSSTMKQELFELLPVFNEVQYQTIPHELSIKNHCVVSSSSYETFALNSLPPIYVQSLKHTYYIDFNSTLNCKTYVCRDNIPFEKVISSECPKYNLDDDVLNVNFALSNDSHCKDRDLIGIKITLKCSKEENAAVIQGSDCYVVIYHETPSICYFSNMLALRNNAYDNYEYILGITISTSIIILIVLVFVIRRYLRKRRQAIDAPMCGNFEFTCLVKQD